MDDERLRRALREQAYLEGDFVLRSGARSTYYLDKYRFLTQPELLEEVGRRLAELASRVDGASARLAAPELGGVVVAAAVSLAGRRPFVIVRGAAKEYGTRNRLEGVYERGERVCLVEDVVTSGGALVDALKAVREAGLQCSTALCVVDREEGAVDALARHAVRLHALFRARELAATPKVPAKPHG